MVVQMMLFLTVFFSPFLLSLLVCSYSCIFLFILPCSVNGSL